jgi:hypothetical protein
LGGRRALGAEMNQALYAHMNNKRKMKKKKNSLLRFSQAENLEIN